MMMQLWDSALMKVLPNYYEKDASPQTLYRIKKDMLRVVRDEYHIHVSPDDARHIKVEWNGDDETVNLVIPPKLLASRTMH